MIGIDLFSGAGGMSLGAEMAGIRVKLSVELDKAPFATYCANHPGAIALRVDAQAIKDIYVPFDRSELVVFGGPPCQGFSTSNQRTRSKDNEKNWLFQAFLGFVSKVLPEWVVFENVRGILDTEGGLFAREVEENLAAIGYYTTSGLLNAADFGVPQTRYRYFIVGRRGKLPPALPTPLSSSRVTVAEAIGDLPALALGANQSVQPYRGPALNPYAQLMRGNLEFSANHLVSNNAEFVVARYPFVPPGGNWQSIPDSLMGNYKDKSRCHTGIYRRLHPDLPAVVIGNFRKNMLIHPSEQRGLSVREAARLQSFPDWYEFHGSIGFQQQQVGNAVPPLLAKAVFEQIAQTYQSVEQGLEGAP